MSKNTIKQRFGRNIKLLDDNYTVVANYHVGTSGGKGCVERLSPL